MRVPRYALKLKATFELHRLHIHPDPEGQCKECLRKGGIPPYLFPKRLIENNSAKFYWTQFAVSSSNVLWTGRMSGQSKP